MITRSSGGHKARGGEGERPFLFFCGLPHKLKIPLRSIYATNVLFDIDAFTLPIDLERACVSINQKLPFHLKLKKIVDNMFVVVPERIS